MPFTDLQRALDLLAQVHKLLSNMSGQQELELVITTQLIAYFLEEMQGNFNG